MTAVNIRRHAVAVGTSHAKRGRAKKWASLEPDDPRFRHSARQKRALAGFRRGRRRGRMPTRMTPA